MKVILEDRRTGRQWQGEIRLARIGDLGLWMKWCYRHGDKDQTWDWCEFFKECLFSEGAIECHALVVCRQLQGLMILRVCDPLVEANQAVVVDYLATNPANRRKRSGLKGVGTVLLAAAVVRSMECGLGGRLWLESLPAAERFYEYLGFTRQQALSSDGYAVYFFNSQGAKRLLQSLKQKGNL